MPEGNSQVDIDDDISIQIIFNDDSTMDENFKRIDFEHNITTFQTHFTLVDINSGERFIPSSVELIDFDDDEVEAKLIWKKKLFDSTKREGYRLRLEFDNKMYDRNNLH